jgi:hypothetical protein
MAQAVQAKIIISIATLHGRRIGDLPFARRMFNNRNCELAGYRS